MKAFLEKSDFCWLGWKQKRRGLRISLDRNWSKIGRREQPKRKFQLQNWRTLAQEKENKRTFCRKVIISCLSFHWTSNNWRPTPTPRTAAATTITKPNKNSSHNNSSSNNSSSSSNNSSSNNSGNNSSRNNNNSDNINNDFKEFQHARAWVTSPKTIFCSWRGNQKALKIFQKERPLRCRCQCHKLRALPSPATGRRCAACLSRLLASASVSASASCVTASSVCLTTAEVFFTLLLMKKDVSLTKEVDA